MQIARAFALSGEKPLRNVIFAFWDGEEKGLLGSKHFVQHCPFLKQIKGYLNFDMALRMIGENEIELSWKAVNDPLEPTAAPEKYIVYTRIGNGDFDNGTVVDKNSYRTVLPAGIVCSYKVTALNKGGESFPSEILSAGQAFNSKGAVLVINGFDRISAPADFVAPAPADTLLAGFLDDLDHGVPYIKDISYIGKMKEFRRSIPWMDDDASGFGDCYGNYETQVIAGNTHRLS